MTVTKSAAVASGPLKRVESLVTNGGRVRFRRDILAVRVGIFEEPNTFDERPTTRGGKERYRRVPVLFTKRYKVLSVVDKRKIFSGSCKNRNCESPSNEFGTRIGSVNCVRPLENASTRRRHASRRVLQSESVSNSTLARVRVTRTWTEHATHGNVPGKRLRESSGLEPTPEVLFGSDRAAQKPEN